MTRKRLLTLGIVLCLAISLAPSIAMARPAYFNTWQATYPDSSSGTNVRDGTTTVCQLCHVNSGGGQPWNAYGWAIRTEFFGAAGGNLAMAIANAESANSDANPAGDSNLDEINANTQPGWTLGPNNSHFFFDGSTTDGQDPPAAILGLLDPPLPPSVPVFGLLGQIALALAAVGGGALLIGRREKV